MLHRAKLRIAVIGGSGTLGRGVVAELLRRGHEARGVGRSSAEYSVDLRTGRGLAQAVEGCDVVVDASNDISKEAAQTLVEGSKRLLAAETAAGVRHHVCVSIVGCEKIPFGYYRVKTDQERVVAADGFPFSIVRSTQFHELLAMFFGLVARYRVIPVPRARLQSIASIEAARAVADVAEGEPLRRRLSVAGPVIDDVRRFAESWRHGTGRRVALLPIPLPGAFGAALRDGALTDAQPDVRGTIPFDEWLSSAGAAAASAVTAS